MARFFSAQILQIGHELGLDAAAARHVQVLRMQPGQALTLFDGRGGEYAGEVTHMGRSEVRVKVLAHSAVEREIARPVHLVLGVPANERMDYLVEKATELGVARISPLMTERGVLRLAGDRAEKKRQHWQQVAIAACEQCGRNRVPVVDAVQDIGAWLRLVAGTGLGGAGGGGAGEGGVVDPDAARFVLSLRGDARSQSLDTTQAASPDTVQATMQATMQDAIHGALQAAKASLAPQQGIVFLSGAEGGLSPAEESRAVAAGLRPLRLGTRTLRAETAPLQALVLFG